MKNFLLTAVLAASAVMPVMAGTALPYSETFDTAADFATMTVVDANNKTWYHSDYYKSAMIDYSDDSSMDDWLILPAFSLAPGGTYTFEMDARCYSSIFGTERFEVKMGTAATAAAANTALIVPPSSDAISGPTSTTRSLLTAFARFTICATVYSEPPMTAMRSRLAAEASSAAVLRSRCTLCAALSHTITPTSSSSESAENALA